MSKEMSEEEYRFKINGIASVVGRAINEHDAKVPCEFAEIVCGMGLVIGQTTRNAGLTYDETRVLCEMLRDVAMACHDGSIEFITPTTN
jgi:hypothetical protein